MWRSLQKQDREQSKGNRALQFKVRNFRTMESNMRKFISRCEFLKLQFRTPLFKVRKFSYRAKLLPGTQVPFRTPQGHFRTPQFKVQNLFQGAKFSFQGANSPDIIFAHHCSRCENFRTVRNPLLAHECHFRTVRNKVRNFRTVRN